MPSSVPMRAPPPGLGVAAPSANPGNAANAMGLVHGALKALQQALPNLPMGSEQHQAVLKCVTDLSKRFPAGDENDSLTKQSMLQMLRNGSQQQPMAALMKMQGGPTAPPAPPMNPGSQGEPPPPDGV